MSPTRGRKKPARRRKPVTRTPKRATRKPKRARRTQKAARRKPKTVRKARKAATRKPKSTRRKSARKSAARPKRSAPARRPRRKPGPTSRKAARRKPAPGSARPRLAVVKALRPKRSVAAPPVAAPPVAAKPSTSFPQRETASVKQLVLFEMVRARAAVMAAVHGLEDASAEAPTAPGKWSMREHVLHLCHWDYEVMRVLDSALRGQAPPWNGLGPEETDRFNDQGVAGLRHLSWSDAERLLLSGRMKLTDEVEAVPEEPAEVWQPEHPFGAMLRDLAWNDRHHADLIKRWRSERSV